MASASFQLAGLGHNSRINLRPVGHRTRPLSQEHSRKALWVPHQIENYLFTGALADLVKGIGLGHFFRRDGCMHAAGKNYTLLD